MNKDIVQLIRERFYPTTATENQSFRSKMRDDLESRSVSAGRDPVAR
jgi:hypothetical protein